MVLELVSNTPIALSYLFIYLFLINCKGILGKRKKKKSCVGHVRDFSTILTPNIDG
jgi:hypothetical protein